uniref:C2H2-type domain-containing protein n=1 Tax=Panagrellus redivivus TaxID=6233 RepID=A0A7E4ZS82_PANRE
MASNSGGASTSASSLMREVRSRLLKNSSRVLTSEAEALLQQTFAKDWEDSGQDGDVLGPVLEDPVVTVAPPVVNAFTMAPVVEIASDTVPTTSANPTSTNRGFMSPLRDQNPQELDFLFSENTLDWVSSLYNSLPMNEIHDGTHNDGDSRMVFDHQLLPGEVDYFGLNRTNFAGMLDDAEEAWEITDPKTDAYGNYIDNEGNYVESAEGSNQNGPHQANGVPMTCAQCGFVASNRKQLWRHGKRENHVTRSAIKPPPAAPKPPKDKVEHQCELCLYTSKSRFNVLRHYQRVHVNQKSTSCEICGKPFKDVDTLKTHIRYTHDNTRRHQCQICEKQFVSSSDLLRHVKIVHDKQRDYVCQKCGKRFQTSTNAKRHYLEVCVNGNGNNFGSQEDPMITMNTTIANAIDTKEFILPPNVVVTTYLPPGTTYKN